MVASVTSYRQVKVQRERRSFTSNLYLRPFPHLKRLKDAVERQGDAFRRIQDKPSVQKISEHAADKQSYIHFMVQQMTRFTLLWAHSHRWWPKHEHIIVYPSLICHFSPALLIGAYNNSMLKKSRYTVYTPRLVDLGRASS